MPSMICNSGQLFIHTFYIYIQGSPENIGTWRQIYQPHIKKISLLQGHPQSVKLQRLPETLRYSKCPVFSLTHLYKSDTLYIVVQGITSQTCHVFSWTPCRWLYIVQGIHHEYVLFFLGHPVEQGIHYENICVFLHGHPAYGCTKNTSRICFAFSWTS